IVRESGGFAIVTNRGGGDDWSVAQVLREAAPADKQVVNLVASDEEDVRHFLRDGTATAAIVDSDETAAVNDPATDLRAGAALFPKQLHVIVNGDSKIASIADLRGKRIAVTELPRNAVDDAMKVYRVSAGTATVLTFPLADALTSLAAHQVDAVLVTARAP